MRKVYFIFCFILYGCVGTQFKMPYDFVYTPIKTETYEIATWQKITNPDSKNIHVYIEGDGYAYNSHGRLTQNPTPRGTFMRDLMLKDSFENVVYMARPCQFIMDNICAQKDWGTGRFSQKIIDAQTSALKSFARNKHITMIGYSGGALLSGLMIKQHPELNIDKWITIAGVLNHKDWTEYFGDTPLIDSLDLSELPSVSQVHFAGKKDKVVPVLLSKKWVKESNLIIIPKATHADFGDIKIID